MPALPDPDAPDARITALIIVGALVLSGGLIWLALGDWVPLMLFAAGLVGLASLIMVYRRQFPARVQVQAALPDWSVTHAATDHPVIAIAITDEAGRMICANQRFVDLFGSEVVPPKLPLAGQGGDLLAEAGRAAWRDGHGGAAGLVTAGTRIDAAVQRVGRGQDYLLWRFEPVQKFDLALEADQMLAGRPGRALGEGGFMAAAISPEGRIRAANSAFAARAAGAEAGNVVGRDLASFLRADERNRIYFEREGRKGVPLRLFHLPLVDPLHTTDPEEREKAPALVVLIDEDASGMDKGTALGYVQNLLGLLPVGLAMTDRDGRFLFANDAFIRAAGITEGTLPPYPGDLVVREDKGALADAVRRHASGQAMSADVALRLRHQPDEPVTLSLAGLRGMGDAAVLLSIKDNSEESRLKRQVAQASKMQAIGQLAGGVAHDFNNVLTAIIGHCDLMLMRHSPGDSDYDDIQQIRSNSNRAASLTRHLLAFSRQQTLRPQVLQLPDIVSDTSELLKRLIGEKIVLEVQHDRNLGPVRADPGQLEQVIVNLAVNARDAMLAKRPPGGTLTIRTRKITAAEVRAMASDILPADDFSAILVEDSGVGIPPDVQARIFEPFFTTKDVGKGTGLGLSTVYGIVKQSGGYIFVDSETGKGTTFSIYFPVYRGGAVEQRSRKPVKVSAGQWGNARLLLVEDEDMVRAVAERALTRQGFTVVTATDGEDGLERLTDSGPFDLVVSDVVMPNLDGPGMAMEMRKRVPGLPILFMSGYAEETLRQSISIDQVHFLPKPFSVAQIVDAVHGALAAAATPTD
ncbi:MAG: response regulator [Blastomonas sp.]|uniref:hybrid sensor histidine kinase/response regulator n=1 Tax=Blastomonas sp. TaxID=1909299 RepID=UPI00258AB653|nr:PAS domain-containing sensor histidine kinase [Blastomonas sp.]MCO5793215.1 response regulator [Blastomonas sp.]